jgi:excisionase family DNA binding protein
MIFPDAYRPLPTVPREPPIEPGSLSSPSELLTIREAAALLRISESTIRNAIRAGLLPAFRFGLRGGRIRIARSDLQNYMQSCLTTAQPQQPSSVSKVGGSTFKNLNAAKLLAAWRRQGVLPDPPSVCSAPSSASTCDP